MTALLCTTVSRVNTLPHSPFPTGSIARARNANNELQTQEVLYEQIESYTGIYQLANTTQTRNA